MFGSRFELCTILFTNKITFSKLCGTVVISKVVAKGTNVPKNAGVCLPNEKTGIKAVRCRQRILRHAEKGKVS